MGIRSDYVETQRKWGLPPRRAWRGQTLRKLGGDGGHAVGQRDTRKSASTRTGAHGNIHYHSVHTRPRHTPRSRDQITGRSGRPGLGGLGRAWAGLAVSPDAPLQRLAQQAAAPARPAQPRQGAVGAGRGKGVCPRPLLRWEQRVWEGRGPGGGAPAPIKSSFART